MFFRCAPPCVHGECIKHASNASLDECDCDLGWTGPVCSVDCQCNNHSTCQTAIGVCDDCQGEEIFKEICCSVIFCGIDLLQFIRPNPVILYFLSFFSS